MPAEVPRKRWLAVPLVALLLSGAYLVKRRYDARVDEQNLADAWDAYRRCLLGEAPLDGEDPYYRVRRFTLTSIPQSELVEPPVVVYPWTCRPFADALEKAVFDDRFFFERPGRHAVKAEEGSMQSPYLPPSREGWAKLWADAALLRAKPVARPAPWPPAAATPLELDEMTPLGPPPLGPRARAITRTARVVVGDRVCAIENGVAQCQKGGALGDENDYAFDDGSVASLKGNELTVTNGASTVRATLEKPAVLRGDAVVWIEDQRLIARDLRPHEPLLGPRTVVGPFSNLFGAACRNETALFVHGSGLAVRTGTSWTAHAAPEGRLSCYSTAVITSMGYADRRYSLRASRCGAESCSDEHGAIREWTWTPASDETRLGPLFYQAGTSLAVIDDRDGLSVRAAPTAPALGSTPRKIVLDSSPVGGKHLAWLREVVPVVGGLVLLIESRGAIYGMWVHGDVVSAITVK